MAEKSSESQSVIHAIFGNISYKYFTSHISYVFFINLTDIYKQ